MSGHTPGPWKLRYEGHAGQAIGAEIEAGTGLILGYVGSSEADARLIVAAPDLYHAAVWVLHNVHGISRSGEDGVSAEEESASWAALMAATKKAEGR